MVNILKGRKKTMVDIWKRIMKIFWNNGKYFEEKKENILKQW